MLNDIFSDPELDKEASEEEMKAYALSCAEKIHIQKPARDQFLEGKLLCSDYGIVRELKAEEKQVVEAYLNTYGGIVYHCITTDASFGRLLNLLIVSQYPSDWECDDQFLKHGRVYAYVWNYDFPDCSEFGTIAVEPYGEGLFRIA